MARVNRPVRALGVLEPRWTPAYLSGLTTAVSSDPRPGAPVTDSDQPRLVPQIVGAQSQTIEVEVLQGGYPQLGGSSIGVGYYLADETTNDARGIQLPTSVYDVRTTSALYAGSADRGDACYDPVSGRVFVLLGDHMGVYSPHTDEVTDVTAPADIVWDGLACAYLADQRLVIVGLEYAAVSDDHGDTWTAVGSGTDSAFSGSPTWLLGSSAYTYRVVPDGYGSLLWIGSEDGTSTSVDVRMAASDDVGASWTEVEITNTASPKFWDAAPMVDGGIALVIVNDDGDTKVRFWLLPDAYTSPDDLDYVEIIPDDAAVREGVAIACDTNGVLWLYLRLGASDATETYNSTDRGATWNRLPDFASTAWVAGLIRLRACPHPGGGLAAAAVSSTGTGIGVLQLGAWTAPGRQGNDWAEDDGTRKDLDYIGGVGSPDGVYSLTLGGTGGTGTGADGYFRIWTGGSAATRWYDADVYLGARDECAAEAIVAVTAGSVAWAAKLRVTLNDTSGGGPGFVDQRQISIEIRETGFRVYDDGASAVLSGPHTVDMTIPTHFRLSVDGATGRVMWRQGTATAWEEAALAGIDQDTVLGTVGVSVRFGILDSVADTELQVWRVAARGKAADRKRGLENTGIGATRYPCPDAHDADRERAAYLQIAGGPCIPGEHHVIAPAYGYGVINSFPTVEPSPSRVWRSGDPAEDQDVLVDLGDDTDLAGSPSIALVVRNANVRRVDLLAMEDGGSSVTVVETMNLAVGFASLSFTRSGDRLVPASTETGARYLRTNEPGLVGGSVRIDGDAAYTIRAVRAGWWDATADVQAAIYLDGVDGGTPSSGTCSLLWHSGVLVYRRPVGTAYRYWGWRVRADDVPVTGDTPQIGCAYLFGLQTPGKQWSNGEEWVRSGNVRAITDDAGTQRRKQLGPTRRSLSIAWDEGALQSRSIRRDSPDGADWIGPAGIPEIGRDDVSGVLAGVLEGAKGGELPVLVLLADAPTPSGGVATETITDSDLWMVGYVQEVRDTHAIADANRSGGDAPMTRNSIGTIVEAV